MFELSASILLHLIWVCTVCQLPFQESLGFSGLNALLCKYGQLSIIAGLHSYDL